MKNRVKEIFVSHYCQKLLLVQQPVNTTLFMMSVLSLVVLVI